MLHMSCFGLNICFYQVKEKAKLDEANKNEDVKGIPSFWLTIFKNVEMLAEMVQEADEPVLESLTDITVTFSEKDPMGFTLHFHFAPNQFFTNSILTKCYEMKCEPPEDDPFSFEVGILNILPMNQHWNCLCRALRSSSALAVPLTGRRGRT